MRGGAEGPRDERGAWRVLWMGGDDGGHVYGGGGAGAVKRGRLT